MPAFDQQSVTHASQSPEKIPILQESFQEHKTSVKYINLYKIMIYAHYFLAISSALAIM